MSSEPQRLQAGHREGHAYESVLVELIDRIEAQAAEIGRLRLQAEEFRTERERLRTELAMAQGWVRELARALEDADTRLTRRPPAAR